MLNFQNKKGGIDWCTATYNPISGCLHGCEYCYLKRMKKRFGLSMEPAFHPDRLKDLDSKKLKPGDKIFVGSSADMFGEWVPAEWIEAVLSEIKKHPELIFQFLTKNPKRYLEFDFPINCWLGMTVDTNNRFLNYIEDDISDIIKYKNLIFMSFEPLLEEINPAIVIVHRIDWIIIGANSNPGAIKPPAEWADKLIQHARLRNMNIWMKDNYKYKEVIKEWPEKR